jgi:hypothetical protein
VDNFFIALYKKFQSMGMNGKDLDYMLDALPWKLVETRADGTEVYECEVKE